MLWCNNVYLYLDLQYLKTQSILHYISSTVDILISPHVTGQH